MAFVILFIGGEGSTLIGTLSQIFSFFLVTPPLKTLMFSLKWWTEARPGSGAASNYSGCSSDLGRDVW